MARSRLVGSHALESVEVDDPDFDQQFIDFRAGNFSETWLERDCGRSVRVAP